MRVWRNEAHRHPTDATGESDDGSFGDKVRGEGNGLACYENLKRCEVTNVVVSSIKESQQMHLLTRHDS